MLQSKKRKGSSKNLDSPDDDNFQKPDADPQQWRQTAYIGSKERSVRNDILNLLPEFASMCNGSPRTSTTVKHQTDLKADSRPAFQHLHRIGLKTTEREGQEIVGMLNEGVIEPVVVERASSVVFTPKNDCKLRFCVDSRKLDAMTIPNTYRLSHMDESLHSLWDATSFPMIDRNSGYSYVAIREADRDERPFPAIMGCSNSFGCFLDSRMHRHRSRER